jgi:hypothetical protein
MHASGWNEGRSFLPSRDVVIHGHNCPFGADAIEKTNNPAKLVESLPLVAIRDILKRQQVFWLELNIISQERLSNICPSLQQVPNPALAQS